MSSNQKICGLSYKLLFPKDSTDKDKQAYVSKILDKEFTDEDDLFYALYENRDIKNKWVLTSDYNNDIGWMYITDTGESFGDINFKMSYVKMEQLRIELFEIMYSNGEFQDLSGWNVFAIDYYNGSDCPFKF